jgi:UV radiation resistance-associated gene protein
MRNLNVVPSPNRSHGKTTTDDDVPFTLKSPTKLLAQSEAKSLHHTRSFTNLKSSGKSDGTPAQPRSSSQDDKVGEANGRPKFGKLRRRSTLHWTGASPEARQKKLEDVIAERMTDSWFSLHMAGMHEPIYISEVIDKSMNPSFRFFDLNVEGPEVARGDKVQLKLWARTEKLNKYILLIDLEVCLRSLQFIGKSLENFHQPLPQNCVLFHLEDGIYTSFTDMPVEDSPLDVLSHGSTRAAVSKPDKTSSYDALMQLANLDDCIQDAFATRAKIEGQINNLLAQNTDNLEVINKERKAKEAVKAAHHAISTEQKQNRSLTKKRDDLLASLKLRRDAIQSGRAMQHADQSAVHELQKGIKDTEAHLKETLDDSAGQIRRICEDLMRIYPIEPIKNRPLHFSICNLYLPNSVFDDTNRDEIAAALGYTSSVTHMLSLYLSTHIPYPISSNGSASTIEDPISMSLTQRIFPLYPTNVSYKFEYGVFLLNKDIEFLMAKQGLRMLDIRHTLPNLKYLLYVLTAGTGELPARKAGGIRGLIAGRATPTISRRGSEDSVHSTAGFTAQLSDGQARLGSLPVPVKGKEKEKAELDVSAGLVPSPGGKTHAYHQSSLREAF